MDTSFLEDIGLTKTESKIYLTIIDLGSSLAGTISQNSGIHRRSVYDAIERLIEKGLVSFISKNNRKWFEAVEPSRLVRLAEERVQNLMQIMPQLESRFEASKEKQEAVFFKGKIALKSVFDDQLKEKKPIYIMGASPEATSLVQFYFNHYNKKRKASKIHVSLIFPESARGTEAVKNIPLSRIKFMSDKYISPVGTNIYGDKVAIIAWTEEPIAILIKNRIVAESYKKHFDFLWERADD